MVTVKVKNQMVNSSQLLSYGQDDRGTRSVPLMYQSY